MIGQWISWRFGRQFRSWHKQDGALTVTCGMLIPPHAAKCYRDSLPEADVCKTCKKLLAQLPKESA